MILIILSLFLNSISGLNLLQINDCGTDYGCWSFPPDCADASCHGIVKWKQVGSQQFEIQMQGKDVSNFEAGRYIALGFSEDAQMGDDTVLECVIDADGQSGQAFISFNDGTSNVQLLDASTKLLQQKETLLKDGRVVCSFLLDLSRQAEEGEKALIYDVSNSTWTLFYASGNTVAATGEKLIHSLDEGDFYPWQTAEPIRLTKTTKVTQMTQ